MLLNDLRKGSGREIKCTVPVHGLGFFATVLATHGLQQPGLLRDRRARGERQCGALGAESAEIRRMIWITPHASDLRALAFDDHAAAYAAIGAGAFCFFHCQVSSQSSAPRRACDGALFVDCVSGKFSAV